MISTDLHKWIRDDHWDIVIKSYTYKCILCSLTGGLETLSRFSSCSHCPQSPIPPKK